METNLDLVKRKNRLRIFLVVLLSIFIVFNTAGLAAGNYFYNLAVHKVHNQGTNYYAKEVSKNSFDDNRFVQQKGWQQTTAAVDDAAHAKSITVNRQVYEDNLYRFIDEALKR